MIPIPISPLDISTRNSGCAALIWQVDAPAKFGNRARHRIRQAGARRRRSRAVPAIDFQKRTSGRGRLAAGHLAKLVRIPDLRAAAQWRVNMWRNITHVDLRRARKRCESFTTV
jgi:hypothetical protein